jgi:hypothetical protein
MQLLNKQCSWIKLNMIWNMLQGAWHFPISITQDTNSNAAYTGAVMAHEMGHNFGLLHDDGKINF